MSTANSNATGIVADTLFVALTRPAMALGVPYAVLLSNAVITVEAFLIGKNLFCLLICLPLHALSRLACYSEPRYFELWSAWARYAIQHALANASYWRGRTFSPLPIPRRPVVRP